MFVNSLDQALDEVRQGKHWGVMDFHANYSTALYDRFFGMMEMKQVSAFEMFLQNGIFQTDILILMIIDYSQRTKRLT